MRKILLLAGISALLGGCVGVPFVVVHTVVPPSSFVLGERVMVVGEDRDRIEVRPYGGAFRSLYFVVEDRDVEIYDVVVIYADGGRERHDGRLVFSRGSRSQTFFLHGGPRRIRGIEFRYHTLSPWADHRARVVVYGVR